MEEAAGKSEVNPAPVRAVAGRAPYLTNITPAATKTIAAVGPPILEIVGFRSPLLVLPRLEFLFLGHSSPAGANSGEILSAGVCVYVPPSLRQPSGTWQTVVLQPALHVVRALSSMLTCDSRVSTQPSSHANVYAKAFCGFQRDLCSGRV